ncbi:MAG: hypothetical protein AABZ47_04610 [Planctomycetota bacterium]
MRIIDRSKRAGIVRRSGCHGVALFVIGLIGVFAWGRAVASPVVTGDDIIGRFLRAIESDNAVTPEAKTLLRSTWEKCSDCDGAEFLAQGLALISPPIRPVLESYDSDAYETCAEKAGALRDNANPFVAVNSSVYEIKALVAMNRTLLATERLTALWGGENPNRVFQYSYFAPEMSFLKGYCLVADLRYADGEKELQTFLERYPDAPKRLTIAAMQMLTELANREPGEIGEVVDLMKNSHSRLNQGDSGEIVQGRQQKIMDLLDKLVEEAEQKEKKCKCNKSSCDKCNKSGSKSGQQQKPQSPMQESSLPGGSPSGESLREARFANPAESWGTMPPAERDRILQALKESFPNRYRQLVEQYYAELAKKP